MEAEFMLVSAKEMLDKAKAGKYAVGQFNINNLEWTKAILLTAQENNSPGMPEHVLPEEDSNGWSKAHSLFAEEAFKRIV